MIITENPFVFASSFLFFPSNSFSDDGVIEEIVTSKILNHLLTCKQHFQFLQERHEAVTATATKYKFH